MPAANYLQQATRLGKMKETAHACVPDDRDNALTEIILYKHEAKEIKEGIPVYKKEQEV